MQSVTINPIINPIINPSNIIKCRRLYSLNFLILFIIIVIVIVHYNPFSIVTNYNSFFYGLVLFIGSFLLSLFIWYHYILLKNNNESFFLNCRENFAIYLLIIYVIFILYLYFKNPYSIVSKHEGLFIFITIFIGVFLLYMISWYNYAIDNYDISKISKSTVSPVWRLFKQAMIILSGFSISGFILYWIMYGAIKLTNTHSVISSILFLIVILSGLSLLYKIYKNSTTFKQYPVVRIILNTILYIPCIFVGAIDSIVNFYVVEKNRTNVTEIILLFVTIATIALYYLVPYFSNLFILQGGKLLINEPINLNVEKTISTYMELNDIKPLGDITFDYNYSLSCWIYLDSSTSSYFDKYSSILNYGGKPNIQYKASTNTLLITEKMNDDEDKLKKVVLNTGQQLDDEGNLILYKRENVELQKWNNIILNYSGGTLDIFVNGELVKSAMNIVPYMKLDSLNIGTNNGANGGICNLVYFKNTLTTNQIYYLYNSVKYKTPPTLYDYRPTL